MHLGKHGFEIHLTLKNTQNLYENLLDLCGVDGRMEQWSIF